MMVEFASGSTIFIIILFLLYGNFIQSKSIEKSIKEDSNVITNLIFENLYTVMKMGGDKELIEHTIKKIKNNISYANINIITEKNSAVWRYINIFWLFYRWNCTIRTSGQYYFSAA